MAFQGVFPQGKCRDWSRAFLTGICLAVILNGSAFPLVQSQNPVDPTQDPCVFLKHIYTEFSSLSDFDEDGIIQHEFHLELDGDKQNKEEHLVIVSHRFGEERKMILQVTSYSSSRGNGRVKYPSSVKTIRCRLDGGRMAIESSDYEEKELTVLLLEILNGIRMKKKLLGSIKKKRHSGG